MHVTKLNSNVLGISSYSWIGLPYHVTNNILEVEWNIAFSLFNTLCIHKKKIKYLPSLPRPPCGLCGHIGVNAIIIAKYRSDQYMNIIINKKTL